MTFQSIRKIIPTTIQKAGITRQVTAVRVLEVARESITRLWGEEKAAFVQPVSFAEGTLKLAARAPAAAQELRVWETRLQNEINRALGSRVVVTLRFVYN